jgi:L-alanine-DL-glutamate epimerase-like enolase superfamily enzyme
MRLRYYPYTLELKHPFTLASGSRSTTPVMLVEVEENGITGYGEVSMPPYLGESQDTASAFLSRVELPVAPDLPGLGEILKGVDAVAPGNHAAKAGVDIALHDWIGKTLGLPLHRLWGLEPAQAPLSSFTIGIGTPESVRRGVEEADGFPVLKVKLGRDNDREMIEAVREVTDKPIRVDVNQGWTDRGHALGMCEWLASRNVELVEQPMPKDRLDDLAWLGSRSPLPVVADESVERLPDVRKAYGVFDGINVKLMKSTGLREAHAMILAAKSLGMKVMVGCMTETSCGISAAAQLSPLADWADLDGALLVKNDPFAGATIAGGRVALTDRPGIGAVKML